MERIKALKDSIIAQVMSNLYTADYQELGAAIDMIKDLSETAYYCTVTEAMEKSEKEPEMYYYRERMAPREQRDYPMEKEINRKDVHYEGQSPAQRRMYVESKEMHMGKEHQMQELEKYMQDLTADIMDMIKDATPEERQMLQKKVAILATKLNA